MHDEKQVLRSGHQPDIGRGHQDRVGVKAARGGTHQGQKPKASGFIKRPDICRRPLLHSLAAGDGTGAMRQITAETDNGRQ